MARLPRLTIPDIPHHITQRGNRRQQTFFCDEDYQTYLDFLQDWSIKCDVEIWAYCLMPNHTHIIAVPKTKEGITQCMSQTHCRYTRYINFKKGWKGHLWQSRFASFPMDDAYLMNCARYVELNPVRARLCQTAEEWPWSSAAAHISADDSGLCRVFPLLERTDSWLSFLAEGLVPEDLSKLRKQEGLNRPLGSDQFVEEMEKITGKSLKPQKPGPKRQTGEGP